jgi:hypothetical protein
MKLTTYIKALLIIMAPVTIMGQGPLFELLPPKQTSITFTNRINETENLNVLAYEYFYNGGGVAVGDLDNDGLEDIFLVANMGENKLYRNLGNLQFKDITKEAGKELAGRPGGWKTGVTMADVNGDGWLDLYVCYSGKVSDDARRNQLFINQGNGTFKEEAAAYGLDDKSYSTQGAFFDFDNDGDLDLFLLNHSTKKIDNMELARYRDEVDELAGNKLYENQNNHFVDVSKKAGIRQNPLTFGLGIAIADVNQDGWQDVYVRQLARQGAPSARRGRGRRPFSRRSWRPSLTRCRPATIGCTSINMTATGCSYPPGAVPRPPGPARAMTGATSSARSPAPPPSFPPAV